MTKPNSHTKRITSSLSRRAFLSGAAATTAFMIVPRHVLGQRYVAPSEKIRYAVIGCSGQGGGIGFSMGSNPLTQVVALCDVDTRRSEGIEKKFRDKGHISGSVKKYQDFREMFDKMGDKIDACSIGIPDHAHFPVAMLAMSKGIHCYVEKPLAHTFEECELMMAAEKKYKVSCQMGNQGHSGANYYQFKAWTEAGIIKDVTRIDACMNKGRRWHPWGNVQGYPTGGPAPATMDWDTWTGTAEMHPYDGKYDPGNWRGWYIYGDGAFGDWGPHTLDTCHRFLKLGLPTEVEAVTMIGPNDYVFPMGTTIAFRFPAREGMPPCEVRWYDGVKNKPPHPKELDEKRSIPACGKVIYGKDLTFMGGTHSSTVRVIPEEKMKEVLATAPKIGSGTDHHTNFLLGAKGQEKTRSSFDISGPLTQVFMLGCIAQRLGGKLIFDPKTKRITNNKRADALLRVPPRKGWEEYYAL